MVYTFMVCSPFFRCIEFYPERGVETPQLVWGGGRGEIITLCTSSLHFLLASPLSVAPLEDFERVRYTRVSCALGNTPCLKVKFSADFCVTNVLTTLLAALAAWIALLGMFLTGFLLGLLNCFGFGQRIWKKGHSQSGNICVSRKPGSAVFSDSRLPKCLRLTLPSSPATEDGCLATSGILMESWRV